jgi:hypothetical protein
VPSEALDAAPAAAPEEEAEPAAKAGPAEPLPSGSIWSRLRAGSGKSSPMAEEAAQEAPAEEEAAPAAKAAPASAEAALAASDSFRARLRTSSSGKSNPKTEDQAAEAALPSDGIWSRLRTSSGKGSPKAEETAQEAPAKEEAAPAAKAPATEPVAALLASDSFRARLRTSRSGKSSPKAPEPEAPAAAAPAALPNDSIWSTLRRSGSGKGSPASPAPAEPAPAAATAAALAPRVAEEDALASPKSRLTAARAAAAAGAAAAATWAATAADAGDAPKEGIWARIRKQKREEAAAAAAAAGAPAAGEDESQEAAAAAATSAALVASGAAAQVAAAAAGRQSDGIWARLRAPGRRGAAEEAAEPAPMADEPAPAKETAAAAVPALPSDRIWASMPRSGSGRRLAADAGAADGAAEAPLPLSSRASAPEEAPAPAAGGKEERGAEAEAPTAPKESASEGSFSDGIWAILRRGKSHVAKEEEVPAVAPVAEEEEKEKEEGTEGGAAAAEEQDDAPAVEPPAAHGAAVEAPAGEVEEEGAGRPAAAESPAAARAAAVEAPAAAAAAAEAAATADKETAPAAEEAADEDTAGAEERVKGEAPPAAGLAAAGSGVMRAVRDWEGAAAAGGAAAATAAAVAVAAATARRAEGQHSAGPASDVASPVAKPAAHLLPQGAVAARAASFEAVRAAPAAPPPAAAAAAAVAAAPPAPAQVGTGAAGQVGGGGGAGPHGRASLDWGRDAQVWVSAASCSPPPPTSCFHAMCPLGGALTCQLNPHRRASRLHPPSPTPRPQPRAPDRARAAGAWPAPSKAAAEPPATAAEAESSEVVAALGIVKARLAALKRQEEAAAHQAARCAWARAGPDELCQPLALQTNAAPSPLMTPRPPALPLFLPFPRRPATTKSRLQDLVGHTSRKQRLEGGLRRLLADASDLRRRASEVLDGHPALAEAVGAFAPAIAVLERLAEQVGSNRGPARRLWVLAPASAPLPHAQPNGLLLVSPPPPGARPTRGPVTTHRAPFPPRPRFSTPGPRRGRERWCRARAGCCGDHGRPRLGAGRVERAARRSLAPWAAPFPSPWAPRPAARGRGWPPGRVGRVPFILAPLSCYPQLLIK